jgi:hypothetical protein
MELCMDNQTYKLTPEEPFPEDLTVVGARELEVLNSRLHRELDAEYLQGDPQTETEARLAEINEELNVRDQAATLIEESSRLLADD